MRPKAYILKTAAILSAACLAILLVLWANHAVHVYFVRPPSLVAGSIQSATVEVTYSRQSFDLDPQEIQSLQSFLQRGKFINAGITGGQYELALEVAGRKDVYRVSGFEIKDDRRAFYPERSAEFSAWFAALLKEHKVLTREEWLQQSKTKPS